MSNIGAMIMAGKSKNPDTNCPSDTGPPNTNCPSDTDPPKYITKWLEFNPNFRGKGKFARF
jgi:hypothetical protein